MGGLSASMRACGAPSCALYNRLYVQYVVNM